MEGFILRCFVTGFLNEFTGDIQWGFVPNLWPRGMVERLNNWGWQISNSNVVLRAIDPLPTQITLDSTDWDGKRLGDSERERKPERCKRCGEICYRECLWKDLLDTLVIIPLTEASLHHGVRISAEVPRDFAARLLQLDGL